MQHSIQNVINRVKDTVRREDQLVLIVVLIGKLLLVGILLAGLYLRIKYFDFQSLWIDELWRAAAISNPSLWRGFTTLIAPQSIGYFTMSHLMAQIFQNEMGMKFPTLLASIAALILVFRILMNLRLPFVGNLFALAAAAFSAEFLSHTKYLKPYCLEIFIYSGLLFLLLKAIEKPNLLMFRLVFLLTFLANIFAFNSIFLLPGIHIAFLLSAKEHRLPMKRVFVEQCLAGAINLALILLQYKMYLSIFPAEWFHPQTAELIKDYPFGFYTGGFNPFAYVQWFLGSLAALNNYLFFPFFSSFGKSWSQVYIFFVNGLCLFSLLAFRVSRLRCLMVALVATVVTFMLSGSLGFYMVGPIRTNLFMIVPLVVMMSIGYFQIFSLLTAKFTGVYVRRGFATFFAVVAMIPFPKDLNAAADNFFRQNGHESLRRLISFGEKYPNQKMGLVTSLSGSWIYSYYLSSHRDFKSLKSNFDLQFELHLPKGHGGQFLAEATAEAYLKFPITCFIYAADKIGDGYNTATDYLKQNGAVLIDSEEFMQNQVYCYQNPKFEPQVEKK